MKISIFVPACSRRIVAHSIVLRVALLLSTMGLMLAEGQAQTSGGTLDIGSGATTITFTGATGGIGTTLGAGTLVLNGGSTTGSTLPVIDPNTYDGSPALSIMGTSMTVTEGGSPWLGGTLSLETLHVACSSNAAPLTITGSDANGGTLLITGGNLNGKTARVSGASLRIGTLTITGANLTGKSITITKGGVTIHPTLVSNPTLPVISMPVNGSLLSYNPTLDLGSTLVTGPVLPLNPTLVTTPTLGASTPTTPAISLFPALCDGAALLDNTSGVFYAALPNGNPVGYFAFLGDLRYIYHFDMGFEYVLDIRDGRGGTFLSDFKSSTWFYTSPTFAFPYLYDFTRKSVVYYCPDPNRPGHYNTAGVRWFYDFTTGEYFSK